MTDDPKSLLGRHDISIVFACALIESLLVIRMLGLRLNPDKPQPAMNSAFPPSMCLWILDVVMFELRKSFTEDNGGNWVAVSRSSDVTMLWARKGSRYDPGKSDPNGWSRC